MKICICDDEIIIVNQIKQLVNQEFGINTIDTYLSGEELLAAKESYDMIFLDIQMKKISGIETAKKIRKKEQNFNIKKALIIFITGYEAYMAEAFDVNAFHYLIKPIKEEKFLSVLSQAERECKRFVNEKEKFIILKMHGISKKIWLRDIIYLDSYNKKVTIHTKEGEEWCYFKMEEMEKQLGEKFFRCHRSYIVNFSYIKEYEALHIFLLDGTDIPMAKQKYQPFVKAYLHYAKNGGVVNV